MATMTELLQSMIRAGASDLHLCARSAPLYRIDGNLQANNAEKLQADEVLRLVYSIMNERQRKIFEQSKEVDFSFGVKNLSRFRANVFIQRGCASAAIRQIPYTIRPLQELNLPPVVSKLAERPSGLLLVTGATGSGKSTTLASIIDKINTERYGHILTIEDPIEFVHKHKQCLVSQREVFQDSDSFGSALRVALRQDPDVILIGEMRDLETIRAALTLAETGHLTLATLHTNSAPESITRIIDVFPPEEKATVRAQLSMVLEGVISQTLLPRIGGGRVMACEVLVATPGIRAMIRDDKIHQLQGVMEIGQKYGMQTMNSQLAKLVSSRMVEQKQALLKSPDPEGLMGVIGRRNT